MNEKPFHNEPGFEEQVGKDDPRSSNYNDIIHHETVRVAYLGMIDSPPESLPSELHSELVSAAPNHLMTHLANCEKFLHLTDRQMRDPVQENKGVFIWKKLRERLFQLLTPHHQKTTFNI